MCVEGENPLKHRSVRCCGGGKGVHARRKLGFLDVVDLFGVKSGIVSGNVLSEVIKMLQEWHMWKFWPILSVFA